MLQVSEFGWRLSGEGGGVRHYICGRSWECNVAGEDKVFVHLGVLRSYVVRVEAREVHQ